MMQKKTAKTMLQELRHRQKELRSLQEEKEILFTRLTSTTVAPKTEPVQTSGSDDKMTMLTARVIELDEMIQKAIREIVMEQIRAEKIIQGVKSPVHRSILRWYYIEDLKWQEVSDRMHYDIAYVQRLNADALKYADAAYRKMRAK